MRRAAGWWVAVVVLVLAARVYSTAGRRADAFEQRAQRAEAFAGQQAAASDRARLAADSLRRLIDERAVVVRWRERLVREVDSIFPPPDTCLPNLRARDSLIAEQGAQLGRLSEESAARGRALALLRPAYDTLAAVLAARPRPKRLRGPGVDLGAFVGWCGGAPCVGVGVTMNLGGLRL